MSRLLCFSPLLTLLLGLSTVSFAQSLATQGANQRNLSAQEIIGHSLRAHARSNPALTDAPMYRIDAELDLDLFIYRGQLTLSYKNLERDTLNQLNFLLYPNSSELSAPSERRLIISEAKVNGAAVSFDRLAREVLVVQLPSPLAPQETVTVELGFKGSLYSLPPQTTVTDLKLEDLLQTLVHTHKPQGGYGVFSQGDGIVSMALWYPILVAYDDRGWDITPSEHIGDRSYFDVAHYDVSFTTASEASVATTGVEIESSRQGLLKRSRYVAAGVREFSIQASKEYTVVSEQVEDITVRSFVTRRHQSNNQPALQETVSALRTFESIFGPYPYTELEVAESPLIGGAGGVEFPGLITIASLIYDSAQGLAQIDHRSSRSSGQSGLKIAQDFMQESRDFVIAHEVAHQWWNAVVGSDSRQHPFVDEALANYSAAAHFSRTRGPTATQRQLDMMMRLNYHLARLTGMEDQAVDQSTSAFEGLLDYGAIVYGKGALYFWALREAIGSDALHKALSQYYQRFTFRVATGEELRTALASDPKHRARVESLSKRWLDERHGDEDIEGVSLYRTMKIMLGDIGMAKLDPELRRWLNHRGVDALADLVEQALKTGTLDTKRIDYAALTHLLTDLMSEDPEVARWARVASRVLARPNAVPSDLLKEAGRELKAEDPKTALILESAGLLVDALMMDSTPPKKEDRRSDHQ